MEAEEEVEFQDLGEIRIVPSINGGWINAEGKPCMLDLHVKGPQDNYCIGVMLGRESGYDFKVDAHETITFVNETALHRPGSAILAPAGEDLHIDVDAPTAYICDFSSDGKPPSEDNREAPDALRAKLSEAMNFKEIEGGSVIEFIDRDNCRNFLVVLRPGAAYVLPAQPEARRQFTFMSGNIQLTSQTVARHYLRFARPKAPSLLGYAELPPGEEGIVEARGNTTASFLCTEIQLSEIPDIQRPIQGQF